ncbi:zinc finger protein 480-like [Pectinophora gossypiella]|uniref:zinc finger protein 480-like n=1 Tax=Pectinophora gossypiella TaxID=13191 RepID=UPI00214F486C|nr:zinc finger protein 480-like [Pectinophora gossypiella]
MEDYEEFYKTICRVCLSQGNSENMVDLTDTASDDGLSCYGKSVITFANIRLKNDSLPNKMCQDCLFLLKQAIVFKKICEKSDEKLTKMVRKFDSSDVEFKEKVSQFVLFSQYFPDGFTLETSKKNKVKLSLNKTNEKPVKQVETNTVAEVEFPNNDFDDFLSNDYQEESNSIEIPENDDLDVDDILNRIEKIVEMKPESLNNYRKKYKQNKVKQKYKHSKQKTKQKVRQKVEKDIQCKICNKVLANLYTYNSHMLRHTGCRYVCEHCAKKYVTYAELQYHLASSHDIGPHHICKECGFKAPRKFDLVEHIRLHTGERPFACDKCGLTFRRRFVWKKHALYHMEKTVQCPRCPRKFYQRSEMLAHANNVHERVYVYACNECDVTYARPATVRRHLIEKHGVAREMQGRITRINLAKSSIR